MTFDIIEKTTEFSKDFEVDPKLEEGVCTTSLLNKTIDFLSEELNETKDAIVENNISEIVDGFGDISEDNKKTLAMEWVAEGLALCFIGALVLLVTLLAGYEAEAANIVYLASAVMLLVMALLTLLTGARTSVVAIKICPVVKTIVAVLFILGSIL